MTLTLAVATALARHCAPEVATTTMVAVVLNESALDPLVIGDNTSHRRFRPASRDQAQILARDLIARGHSIDMGIAQINSRTAAAIGLSVEDAFDPCASMAAAGRFLVSAYRRATLRQPSARQALDATLSTYNTGDGVRGITNGYVARVYRAAARSIDGSSLPPASLSASTIDPQFVARSTPSPTLASDLPESTSAGPAWVIFGAAPTKADVFAAPSKGR